MRSARGLAANATETASPMQTSLFTSFDYTSDMRWRLPIFLLASLLAAQEGLTPRKIPEDFPVHQDKGRLAIGAEFMVHSFGRDTERYVAEDYLTVEIGVYP